MVQGILEGWIWASPERRINNKIICGNKGTGANGIIDYHAWRLLEELCILCGIYGGYKYSGNHFWSILIGSWYLGVFLYERLLNHIVFDDCWHNKPYFNLMGYNLPSGNIRDWMYLAIGIIFYCIAIFS
jgi:hypothetical protein